MERKAKKGGPEDLYLIQVPNPLAFQANKSENNFTLGLVGRDYMQPPEGGYPEPPPKRRLWIIVIALILIAIFLLPLFFLLRI